jgi:hypothetical protein
VFTFRDPGRPNRSVHELAGRRMRCLPYETNGH